MQPGTGLKPQTAKHVDAGGNVAKRSRDIAQETGLRSTEFRDIRPQMPQGTPDTE
jgi:hypothetical protein